MKSELGGFIVISPTIVANNFIVRAKDEGVNDLTPLKLQKLVYFIYSKYLAETNKSLFNERFETWKYGPVVPSIYTEFRSYGDNPITTFAKDSKGVSFSVREEGKFKECIDFVWDRCKCKSGVELSKLTHIKGSAWDIANEKSDAFLDDGDIIKDVKLMG